MKRCKDYDLPDCFFCKENFKYCLIDNILNSESPYNENVFKYKNSLKSLISAYEGHIPHLRKIIELQYPKYVPLFDKALLLI